LSILQTTLERKTLIKITLFSPFIVKAPKREKSYEAKELHRLLVVLHLLIVVDLLLIAIIIENTSRANTEGSWLGRSQQGVGVGREVRHVRKLLKRLISLAVSDLQIASLNLKALIQHIHALVRASACDKDVPEHLQNARVESRSKGGTTTVGRAGRSGSSSGSTSMRNPWILGHYGVKRVMTHILAEFFLSHSLNHVLNVWSKITRSERVGDDVSYLMHNILEDIKAHQLHESIQ
jgi:hypothetical protein